MEHLVETQQHMIALDQAGRQLAAMTARKTTKNVPNDIAKDQCTVARPFGGSVLVGG